MKQLRGFSDAKGYVAIDQWTPIDVREFRSTWGVLPSTAAKNMSVVKAFFEFCHANEWTSRNPARMVRNQRGQHNDPRSEQKLPFPDEELRRMYDACDTKYGKREIQFSKATRERKAQGPYAQYRARWTGQDIADFISVSVYTGLRISNVSTFHIDRMRSDGTIQLRTTKAHTHVYTWVAEFRRMTEELDLERDLCQLEGYYFYAHTAILENEKRSNHQMHTVKTNRDHSLDSASVAEAQSVSRLCDRSAADVVRP
ncbi:MAG: hypothetical protein WCF26_25675 [Candidatus Sulfotelmatobacter sp.]